MTALPSEHSNGCQMATEEEDDQRTTRARQVWKRRCGQQNWHVGGRRWRRQHRREMGKEEWSVAIACKRLAYIADRKGSGCVSVSEASAMYGSVYAST